MPVNRNFSSIAILWLVLAPNVHFAQSFCLTVGGGGDDRATGVAIDSRENIIVAGYTSSFASGGFGTDFYVFKLDNQGNLVWTRTIGLVPTNYEYCYAVATDQEDNIIIVGRSYTSYKSDEMYIIKLDSAGSVLWTLHLGGPSDDIAGAVAVDSTGNIYFAGAMNVAGWLKAHIVKIDNNGNIVWNRGINGSFHEELLAITIDKWGSLIAAGYTTSLGAGNEDMYVIKLDSLGNLLWTRTIGGTNIDRAWAIETDDLGNIIVVGQTNSFGLGNYDVYVAKLDPSGNLFWTKTIGGAGDDRGYGVGIDTAGNIIITGRTNSFGMGNLDIYIIKLSPSGDLLWTGTIGDSGNDYGLDLSIDPLGNIVIAGFSNSFSTGNDDTYIIRLEPDSTGYKEGCACNLNSGGSTATGGIINSGGTLDTPNITTGSGGIIGSGGVLNNFLPKIQLDSLVDVQCFGQSNGSIFISVTGGTAPYSYLWNTGDTSEDITNMPSGTYFLTVTDSKGCNTIDTFYIMQPPQLIATSLKQDIACYGDTTGWIKVSVTGGVPPYSHSWSNGSTSDSVYNLPIGIYTDTITDDNGCTIMLTDTIYEPPPLTVDSFSVEPLSSCTTQDGSIRVYLSGGTPPYSLLWNNGSTSSFINNLPSGTYTIEITDDNGCQILDSAIIEQPPVPLINIDTSNLPTLHGTITGGTPPYSCLWNTGDSSCSTTISGPGEYSIIVTDSLGCTNTDTITIDRVSAFSSPHHNPCIIYTAISTIEITCSEQITEASVWLPDGRLIKTLKNYNNKRLVIPILTLSQGTYIITIASENFQITHKLHVKVKNKILCNGNSMLYRGF